MAREREIIKEYPNLGNSDEARAQARANARTAVRRVAALAVAVMLLPVAGVAVLKGRGYLESHCSNWDILFKSDHERVLDAIDCALEYGDFKGAERYVDSVADSPAIWVKANAGVDYAEAAAGIGMMIDDSSTTLFKRIDDPDIRDEVIAALDGGRQTDEGLREFQLNFEDRAMAFRLSLEMQEEGS